MGRTRKTARDAGRRMETATAAYLAAMLNDDRIEVRARNGGKDRGDVGGVRSAHGARVVVECKDTASMTLGPWVREAEVERGNDDALVGLVVHKRRGVGLGLDVMGGQYVTMTLEDLVALLTGHRDGLRGDA